MHIKISLTILFFFAALVAKATDISFVVYSVTGAVTKSSKLKIKKGDKILANETIIVADKAAVVLICSNYKTIQLNKKGTYTAKSLSVQCNKDAASYTSSYFKYVWNEFTHPHGKPESNPGEYMKNIGAVSRGCNTVQMGIAADTIHFQQGALPIYWNSSFNKPVLVIYDMPVDGGPLQKTILEKDQPINMEKITAQLPAGEYYWHITDGEGNGCERNYFKIWTDSLYTKKINEILSSVPGTSPAETAFAQAFILQENHFLAEAIQYYAIAVQLEPGNKIYIKALAQFYENE